MSYWRCKAVVECRKLWATLRRNAYARLAAELQDLLLQGWDNATREAIAQVLRLLGGRQPFNREDLDRLLTDLGTRLGLKFANQMAAPLVEIQTNTYSQGLRDVVQVKPTFRLIDQQALEALQRHHIFWVRNYWDAQLGKQVAELGRQILREGLSREQAGQLFADALSGRFQTYSWRYWQGFANHVITRSRELGHVEGYLRAGIDYLQVWAVLDRRTTQICREMHGRIIPVQQAVALRDAILKAQNPEDIKRIAPWRKPEEIAGKPTRQLPPGMALPPYHFNCRTRTAMANRAPRVRDMDLNTRSAGKQLARAVEQTVYNREQLSKKELTLLVERALQAKWPKITSHFKKHRHEKYTGWRSEEEMLRSAYALMSEAERDIYLQIYRDRYPRLLFYRPNILLVVDVEINTIKTMFSMTEIEKHLAKSGSTFILQRQGRRVHKMKKKSEEIARDSFELALEVWMHHVEELLDTSDPYWQDWILLARDEIQEYLDEHPQVLTEAQRRAIEDSDRWFLDHAHHPAIREVIEWIIAKPSMRYWWRSMDTIAQKREQMQQSQQEP